MALAKSLSTKYLVNADYWKVAKVTRSNEDPKIIHILMSGYVNQSARFSGAVPLVTLEATTSSSVLDQIEADDDTEKAYIWIKSNVVDFLDATDILP
jgi:hypothetical protein